MISKYPKYKYDPNIHTDFIVVSPYEAIKLAHSLGIQNLYIAGGSSIYDVFSNLTQVIIKTKFYQEDFDYTQENLIYIPESIVNLKSKFKFAQSKDLKSCIVNYFIK